MMSGIKLDDVLLAYSTLLFLLIENENVSIFDGVRPSRWLLPIAPASCFRRLHKPLIA